MEENKWDNDRLRQEELLRSALAGNSRDLDTLIGGVRPLVSGVLKREARTLQDAEDMVQAVLIAAATGLSKYRRESGFSSWVLGIAGNILRNYYDRTLSRAQRQQSLEDFLEIDASQVKQNPDDMSPIDRAAYKQYAAGILNIALSVCTETEYSVLVMALDDESTADLALLFGITETAVRQHLLRAREKLLAHIVLHQADMMGGQPAVQAAWQKATTNPEVKLRPTPREMEAWQNPAGRAKDFRRACVKMAKWL